MKTLLLTLFLVAVSAVPLPKDKDAVEMTVNEVPDGAALEAGDIVDMKLKKHATGAVVSTNLFHSYTAVGITETRAATATSNRNEASVVNNDNAMTPKLHPIPEVILINSKPAELPQPSLVHSEPKPEQLPVAAAHFNGPVPNDGLVQVQYNVPEEPGMMSTLQEWYKLLVKYFNSASSPAAPVAPVAPIAHQHGH